MRKALLIGINEYPGIPLSCCENDVNALQKCLSHHFDASINFEIMPLLGKEATRANVRARIKQLFLSEPVDVALLYFSGHGIDDDRDGSIVTVDYKNDDYGIRMEEIISIANQSKCPNKIIIFDCCYSGKMGDSGLVGDKTVLSEGTTILTASGRKEMSFEINGHGVFTFLLLEALNGGASDILGRVTPGSIYAYVDQALGLWEQRPVFKTNVSRFISLRNNKPKIPILTLRNIAKYFTSWNDVFALNPSFEYTNVIGGRDRNFPPYAEPRNVTIFQELQLFSRNGLVETLNGEFMYEAAMNSTGCKLTPLGQHYWNLVTKKII